MQTSLFKNEIDFREDAFQKIKPDSPKERILTKGTDSLSNSDLFSLLLVGTPSKSKEMLASEIFRLANNSINSIARLNIKDLMRIEGLGEAQAIVIVASFELNRRRNLEIVSNQKITKSRHAFEILQPLIGDKNYEEFYIICINRNSKVISCNRISDGGITGTVVDVRRIFKVALENNAVSCILGHNHPSGNLNPSDADKIITRNVVAAGRIMDIQVKDHIIVTTTAFYSFADEGLM